MYRISPLLPEDLFSMDLTNLDTFTESFNLDYYLFYLLNHTEDCFYLSTGTRQVFNSIHTNDIHGYVLGKLEEKENVCVHLSALSVSPNSRRLGYGKLLMGVLETNGNLYESWFSDLFVRENNLNAIKFYNKLGYKVYRRVLNYYGSPLENALEMRKSLAIDSEGVSMTPSPDIDADDCSKQFNLLF